MKPPLYAEEALFYFLLLLYQTIQHKHPMSQEGSHESSNRVGKDGL